jgi:hypothetical protein
MPGASSGPVCHIVVQHDNINCAVYQTELPTRTGLQHLPAAFVAAAHAPGARHLSPGTPPSLPPCLPHCASQRLGAVQNTLLSLQAQVQQVQPPHLLCSKYRPHASTQLAASFCYCTACLCCKPMTPHTSLASASSLASYSSCPFLLSLVLLLPG